MVCNSFNPVEIKGHDNFIEKFSNALTSGKIHHAWLLCGPGGTGKATMARLTAAWLLRGKTSDNDQFFDHSSRYNSVINNTESKLVFSGSHPDYMYITPLVEENKSGQIKIEQIRKLGSFFSHKPARSGWRVAIVDSVDDVNLNSANALLKILEEPPANTIIFLISSRPGQILPTLRSRCLVFNMGSLSETHCNIILTNTLISRSVADVENLSILCAGSPGRALQLSDSASLEHYIETCELVKAKKFDFVGAFDISKKWGRAGSELRGLRDGAVYCIERLFYLPALVASGHKKIKLCNFENSAIAAVCQRHRGEELAEMHRQFLMDLKATEDLYLDFSQFLFRQLEILCD